MLSTDEGALICDFAETYHILDFRELPARRAALLACGLGSNARIRRALSGQRVSDEELLLATVVDALHIIIWQIGSGKAKEKPVSIVDRLMDKPSRGAGVGFDSPEDFRAWHRTIMEG